MVGNDPDKKKIWWLQCVFIATTLFYASNSAAQTQPSVAVLLDNDSFYPGKRDYDYTNGVAIAFYADDPQRWPISLDRPLGILDRWWAPETSTRGYGLQAGILSFTPEDLKATTPIFSDRPYASLIYWTNSRLYLNDDSMAMSSLTLGVIGSPLAGSGHRAYHRAINRTVPQGYDYQISEGGELTARYSLSKAKRWLEAETAGGHRFDSGISAGGSVGYLNEVWLSAFGRWAPGRWAGLDPAWWGAAMAQGAYIADTVPVDSLAGTERSEKSRYLFAGVRAVYRPYNVFLRGQFRDSIITIDSDNIQPWIGEAWLGGVWRFQNGWRGVYFLRYQSDEVKDGPAARTVGWGGFVLSKSY